MTIPPSPTPVPERPRQTYVPAVGPRLKKLLLVLFGFLALLGANSVYLASITALEWATGNTYQNFFYQYMFLGHLFLGLLFIGPFVVFSVAHVRNTRQRKNRRALRAGIALLAAMILVLLTGVLLLRVGLFDLKRPAVRSVVYWCHVIAPLVCLWLYWLHRLAGPRIKWKLTGSYAGFVSLAVVGMVLMHTQDPRKWNVVGPKEGTKYFEPSLARTATGNFIPPRALMMDQYCRKCHADAHAGWEQSAHRLSSFNNATYLASIRETRDIALKRDGSLQASRWCAGCHDPVPFFSGAFDDAQFDLVGDPLAQQGITCTSCHAITHVNSTRGNADYTIEEPQHYPFAYSDNPALQWINNQLVKAKPSFHKKTFLKDFHKSAEFCSTCHKVHIPYELNHYKQFLRGQNHYDSFLLSGVSGHGARSFYYPPVAKTKCSDCHMPLKPSNDFGALVFDDSETLKIHDHLFPAANTGVAWLNHSDVTVEAHQEFLKKAARVDIFGLKDNGTIDGTLHAPLRPHVPTLRPGSTYLLETVIRTLNVGHLFTQGTVDSNEVWMDITVSSGGRVIGRSGAIGDNREVDPWSYFVNVFLLDKDGNRIDRRNPQDIFVPLYNHQIPPGAARVVHYELQVPDGLTDPVTVDLKLQYRKFDKKFMDYVTRTAQPGDLPIRGHDPGKPYLNNLPITTLASDSMTFPIEQAANAREQTARDIPTWQRWNDYGIGLFLEGKAELRQAADAFMEVEKLDRYDGPLNLARVYEREGRIDEAADAIRRAAEYESPHAPRWTLDWMSGVVNRQLGRLDDAQGNFRTVLETHTEEMHERRFDFSKDFVVINLLGQTYFDLARQIRGSEREQERRSLLNQAVVQYEKTLTLDAENLTAHYNLQLLYTQLGDEQKSAEHQELHARYKPDDNARDRAVALARKKYAAANHAAEPLVIYSLHRQGAPGLPTKNDTE